MSRPHQPDLPQSKSAPECFSETYAHGPSRTLPQRATDTRDAWEEAELLEEPAAAFDAAKKAAKKAADSLEEKQRKATIFSSEVVKNGGCSDFAALAQAASLAPGFGSLPVGESSPRKKRRCDDFNFIARCNDVNGIHNAATRVSLDTPAEPDNAL
jgi:hypothetical protein